ncbi:MAG: hypothetical protein PV358_03705, partial [Acidimicrobiales bacterium]|nr:hypothetical protein [Acidimicrobiales bacterium]
NDALRSQVDKVLRQRNALLKQTGGRLDEGAAFTLDVWDAKLAEAGAALAAARVDLLDRMRPVLASTYDALARRPALVTARYDAAWASPADVSGSVGSVGSVGPVVFADSPDPGRSAGSAGMPDPDPRRVALREALARALADARTDDVRRGVSTVGPHRDDVVLSIGDGPARTQASQGEQRTLALALRLAVHHVVTAAAESPPVLLLDDVFSELDPDRSAALLANLPEGQTLITTATTLPVEAHPDRVLHLVDGQIVA